MVLEKNVAVDALAFQIAEDVKIFVEVLEFSVGVARIGILYNFGERSSRKFFTRVQNPATQKKQKTLTNILTVLKNAGWFDSASVSLKKNCVTLTIHNCFERHLGLQRCDFLRGFLNGTVSEIFDNNYYCVENCKDKDTVIFVIKEVDI